MNQEHCHHASPLLHVAGKSSDKNNVVGLLTLLEHEI
jgi:hypothetical protein